MKILVYGYSDETTLISQPVRLIEALGLLDGQDTQEVNKNNYIGFQLLDSEACFQFMRISKDNWILDLPIYKKGEFVVAKQSQVPKEVVQQLVLSLYDKKNDMKELLLNEEYDKLEHFIKRKWNISLNKVKED